MRLSAISYKHQTAKMETMPKQTILLPPAQDIRLRYTIRQRSAFCLLQISKQTAISLILIALWISTASLQSCFMQS